MSKMNTTKALSDEQIEEIRRRYAAGEHPLALADEYHVSRRTISNYVRSAVKKTELTPESDDALDVIYNLARGIEIFVRKHTVGEFTIHVSRENESTTVTAVAGDKEITIKHREPP